MQAGLAGRVQRVSAFANYRTFLYTLIDLLTQLTFVFQFPRRFPTGITGNENPLSAWVRKPCAE